MQNLNKFAKLSIIFGIVSILLYNTVVIPLVLGGLGLLNGRRATCYPGFEQTLTGATYTAELCTVDGNITTGEGPAAAFPYAYTLLARLTDQATADAIAEGMRYVHLMSGEK